MAEDFTQAFTTALLRGQQYRRNKRIEDEEIEDREIEKESLQLRLKQLKIQEKLQAREAAAGNYRLLEGMPEENFPVGGTPETGIQTKSAPSVLGPGFGTMEVPERQVPTIDIPGIEELGVPGTSVKPRTMEQVLAEQFAVLRQRALATPRSVGRYSDLVDPATGEVIYEGEDSPDRLYQYRNYDPATGKETVEMLTAEEYRSRPPATRRPPQQGGGNSNKLTPEEIADAVDGFKQGLIPVDKIPTSNDGIRLLSAMKNAGINVTKAANDLRAFRSYMATLNGNQQQELLQAADTAEQNLTALEEINTRAGNPRVWTPGIKDTVDMEAAAKAAVDALAFLKAGGSQPNNAVIERATEELSTGLFKGPLGPKILRLKEALKYRVASVRRSMITTDETGMAPAPAPGTKPQSSTGTGGKTAADVKAALTAAGRADDDATVAAVMASPAAMGRLFPGQAARK